MAELAGWLLRLCAIAKQDAQAAVKLKPRMSASAALQKRKALLKNDPRAKHYLWSSLLLGVGGTFAIVGPLNTYLRTGKLFPGESGCRNWSLSQVRLA